MPVDRVELEQFLADLLCISEFEDYGPNGLQIEGCDEIKTIAFSVSATRDSIQHAIEQGAEALIVHHGLFWNFHGVRPLTGAFAQRVLPLIRAELNLFAYHLPLDAHPLLGNAATLASGLGLIEQQRFGCFKGCPTGVQGRLTVPISGSELKQKLVEIVSHSVLHADPGDDRRVRHIGIITGGANGDWKLAVDEGLDAYITGEMSEHDWHEAREAGIHMLAAGHHASEEGGVKALMANLSDRFELQTFYIPSDNPA